MLDMSSNQLEELRRKLGKTLRQVGKETGIHFEYIRLFERKLKVPTEEQKGALERYYWTDLSDYFTVVRIMMLLRKARKLEEEAFLIFSENSLDKKNEGV